VKPLSRFALTIPLTLLLIAQSAVAFEYPLSSEMIREAYFLATEETDRSAPVFSRYIRTFPPPEKGPHVAAIEFQTPFIVVADAIALNGPNYRAPDAAKDFLGKPEICRVHVQVFFAFNEYESFTLQLIQDGKEISIQSKYGDFLYTSGESTFPNGLEEYVEYAADSVDADKPVTVQVIPDGWPAVETSFDLSQLR
jgi:hypothetical protein